MLLAILFGSTGTLVAPLTARLLQEVAGNVLVRYHAQGGPAAQGDKIWISGAGSNRQQTETAGSKE